MRKRVISALLATLLVFSLFAAGCGRTDAPQDVVKVGMVTDTGTIDDKSFNEGTWNGILKYKEDTQAIEEKYLQPSGEQHTDYLAAINDLVDNEYSIIVTPGFKFETAVNEAAGLHEDVTFILIDGMTHAGDMEFVAHDNVVCIYFNEHETGFLAGVAAALSSKTGKLGFIGGMEIPAVQRFGWGFVAGMRYANATYGTNAVMTDYIYQGTFIDTAAGQTLAAGMYDKGIDIIFAAAGGVGLGVFSEAKQRAEQGEEVYVIGVDSDQYEQGVISSGKSITLTSAMKRVDVAAYEYIDAKLKGTFPGGEIITLALADGAVDLPAENPNLSEDTLDKISEVKQAILDEEVVVPATQEELDAFLQ
ncbi:MAG: BMP family lipoprotein [bacterium]|jgi:basic membrane protein A